MNLYELNKAIEACVLLEDGVVDTESGEIMDFAQFEALILERKVKLENLALYIKNKAALAAAIKAEKDALEKRMKAAEAEVKRCKEYLASQLGEGEKVETAKIKISYKNTESVVVENMDKLPADYIRVKTSTEPDKVAIKAAIKAGHEVAGAKLQTNRAVLIK